MPSSLRCGRPHRRSLESPPSTNRRPRPRAARGLLSSQQARRPALLPHGQSRRPDHPSLKPPTPSHQDCRAIAGSPRALVYHPHQRPCSFLTVLRNRCKLPPLRLPWFAVAAAALARSPSVSALNRVRLKAGRPLPSRPRPSSACYEPPSPCHGLASAESPAFDPPWLGPHLDAVSRPGRALPESRPSAWFPPSRYEMYPSSAFVEPA